METKTTAESREERRTIWAGHIEEQGRSGKGVRAYCVEKGLKPWQFFYWRGALRRRDNGANGFIEVKMASKGHLTIEVGQVLIKVEPGFDPALLKQVVHTLRDA